ncbi:MAG: hypothetical protein IIB57_10980 [Planctomycetes bacterium]|nr:hypothetical protein [Planctomycetota bacterium]
MGQYRRLRKGSVALLLAAIPLVSPAPTSLATEPMAAAFPGFRTVDGIVTFSFNVDIMEELGWTLASSGAVEGDRPGTRFSFPLTRGDTFLVEASAIGSPPHLWEGSFETSGALLVTSVAGRMVVGNFVFGLYEDREWEIRSHLGTTGNEPVVFRVTGGLVDFDEESSRIRIGGDLRLAPFWTDSFGDARLAAIVVGTFEVDAEIESGERDVPGFEPSDETDGSPPLASTIGRSVGADIIVSSIHDLRNYGTDLPTNISAFAIGTIACNAGDVVVSWFGNTPNHPVIAQNVYRLKESRFEQIGLAWVKHGFYSMSDLTIDLCIDCQPFPILPGDEFLLKVGCKDMYDQRLNGDYAYLGPRQIVNASTGEFVLTYTAPTEPSGIDRRVQLHDVDLDPDLNAGALYFYEGQYIAADDAAAGNNNNNATYRPLTVLEDTLEPNNFLLRLAGSAQDTKPGILAWQDNDTDVRIEYIDVPNDGRLILGCKVWRDSATGLWHYEYAVQNLNSHRSARALSVPVPPGIDVTTIDFHDINVHSGAPCDVDGTPCQTTDWASTLGGGQVSWSTDTFAANEFANAIRWGSLYNFRFDADTCPTEGTVTLGLFRDPQSGDPTAMSVPALVPGDPIVLIDSQPIDGSIDARQPSNPDGTNPAGWQEIQLVFNRCATDLTSLDFSIDPAVPAAVATPASDTTIDFLFEAPINVKVWTTITHTATNTAIDVGYLPADINADGVSQSNDIAALTAALDTLPANGTTPPMHSIDIDRSDAPTAADILRAIDLLNGADDYEEFLDAALP